MPRSSALPPRASAGAAAPRGAAASESRGAHTPPQTGGGLEAGGGERPGGVAACTVGPRGHRAPRVLADAGASSRSGKGRAPVRPPQDRRGELGARGWSGAFCSDGPAERPCARLGSDAAGVDGAANPAKIASRCGSPPPGASGWQPTRWSRCVAGRNREQRAQLGLKAGLARFGLLCCYLAALPIASDADQLALKSPTASFDRNAVRGEPFQVQPRLELRDDNNLRLETAGGSSRS